ncbi:MAG: FkbM family methyltransferase [Sarcina sp.]
MRNKVLVFGVGKCFDDNKNKIEAENDIIGFIDNFSDEKMKNNKKIYRPAQIKDLEFDKIIICSMYIPEIWKQLIDIKVERTKINLGFEHVGLDEKTLKANNARIYVEAEKIIFEQNTLRMYITTTTDVTLVNELFIFDEYNYYFSPNNQYIVIDIGANVGDTALYFAKNKNVEKVIGFEPFYQTYQKALENIELNQELKEKITLNNYGLGDKNEFIEVTYDESFCGSMSSVRSNECFGTMKCEIEIRDVVKELKKYVENIYEEKVVLKIDCEGAEFEIFRALSKERQELDNVEAILMEWHERNPKELIEILNKMNFKVFCRTIKNNIGMIYAMK